MLKTLSILARRGDRVVIHDGKRTIVAVVVRQFDRGEVRIELDVDQALTVARGVNEQSNKTRKGA